MSTLLSSNLMHLIPLIIAVSIVYGAGRDERPRFIIQQTIRSIIWMATVLGLIIVALLGLGALV